MHSRSRAYSAAEALSADAPGLSFEALVMGIIVIAIFRPKRGKAKQLVELVRQHVPLLRSLGLATAREAIIGRAKDGAIIEMFEWQSQEAIDRAHKDPLVGRLWKKYEAVSTHCKLIDLAEASDHFPAFEPIEAGPKVGAIEWCDLTVPDAKKLSAFYEKVVGYRAVGFPMGDYEDYCMNASDGRTAAGVCHARGKNKSAPQGWLVYITVADLKKSLATAKKLGGAMVGKPRSAGGGSFCVIRDPSGAQVALYARSET